MSHEWPNEGEHDIAANMHVAALLTSALIARSTHPCGTSAPQEATNAANLYRCVLAELVSDSERRQPENSVSPTMDSAAMQGLDVSRDGVRYRYKTFLYDHLDDALAYARLDRERQSRIA